MKLKILLLTMCILLLSGSSMALEPSKKVGYGFGPGLEPGKDFVAGQLIVKAKPGLSVNGFNRLPLPPVSK